MAFSHSHTFNVQGENLLRGRHVICQDALMVTANCPSGRSDFDPKSIFWVPNLTYCQYAYKENSTPNSERVWNPSSKPLFFTCCHAGYQQCWSLRRSIWCLSLLWRIDWHRCCTLGSTSKMSQKSIYHHLSSSTNIYHHLSTDMNVPIDPHRFDVLFSKALPRLACGFKGFGFCGFCFAFFARRAVAAVAASRAVATVTWGGGTRTSSWQVDGRNAPPNGWNPLKPIETHWNPINNGIHNDSHGFTTYQLVQDFFHPPYFEDLFEDWEIVGWGMYQPITLK